VSWRIAAFAGGLAGLWIAVASPVSHLDHHLLTAHMVQHLFLMLVAAPLVLLGVRSSLRLHWRPNLVVSWLAGSLTVIIWHVPAIFELALRSPFWHAFEQASFFVYPHYLSGHGLFGLSPLDDQALAGALMWVTVTFAYLIPALVLTSRLLSGERRHIAQIWAS
jgi:putative membrane protein